MAGRSNKKIVIVGFCLVVCLQLYCILGHHPEAPSSASSDSHEKKLKDVEQELQVEVEKNKKLQGTINEAQERRTVQPVPPLPTRKPKTSPPEDQTDEEKPNAKDAAHGALQPPASRHSFSVHVFTYNRLPGLKRLLASLVDADYSGDCSGDKSSEAGCALPHDVHLKVFMDYPKKGAADYHKAHETREYLNTQFSWPHGKLSFHRREVNVGLKKSIMEAWYPMSEAEVGAFFEDDVEVSSKWFQWTTRALDSYAPLVQRGHRRVHITGPGGVVTEKKVPTWKTGGDPKLLGISLFRPIHDELSAKSCKVSNGHNPFLLQQPCSWGAVYLPKPWRAFRDWYDEEGVSSGGALKDPNDPKIRPSSNTWASSSSWKKYLIKRMYEMGWFMVYPNPPNNKVLSTNHLMEGEHPTPPKALFELPLVKGDKDGDGGDESDGGFMTHFPELHSLQAYDVMFRRTKGDGTVRTLPNYEDPAPE